jgi:hypothetical protein
VATAKSNIPTGGMGFVRGIGEISKIANQEIQRPLNRQVKGFSAIFAKRGRVIFSKILVTRCRFLRIIWVKGRGNLYVAIFLGSQGDRLPKAICTDSIKQAPPNGPVNPGGTGNKNGKTNNIITKLKPRSEVSAKISPRLRGCWANLCSRNLISWENLRCIVMMNHKISYFLTYSFMSHSSSFI